MSTCPRFRLSYLLPVFVFITLLSLIYVLASVLAYEMAYDDRLRAHSVDGYKYDPAADNQLHNPPALSMPNSIDSVITTCLRISTHLSTNPSCRVLDLLLLLCCYLLKQSFSLPGSALLNISTGFIFGPIFGVPLVAVFTTIGCASCFALSYASGQDIIDNCAPVSVKARIDNMRGLVLREKQSSDGNLFLYMLTLRIFPMTPHFLLNISSPHIGVPFATFALSTIVGIIPYAYITVLFGTALKGIAERQHDSGNATGTYGINMSDMMDGWTMAKLVLLAGCMLLPTIIKKRRKSKSDDAENSKNEEIGL